MQGRRQSSEGVGERKDLLGVQAAAETNEKTHKSNGVMSTLVRHGMSLVHFGRREAG